MKTYENIIFIQNTGKLPETFFDMDCSEQCRFLMQWDNGDNAETRNHSPAGSDDTVTIHDIQGNEIFSKISQYYELSINSCIGYVGLCRVTYSV